jgi:hypothetical protein
MPANKSPKLTWLLPRLYWGGWGESVTGYGGLGQTRRVA